MALVAQLLADGRLRYRDHLYKRGRAAKDGGICSLTHQPFRAGATIWTGKQRITAHGNERYVAFTKRPIICDMAAQALAHGIGSDFIVAPSIAASIECLRANGLLTSAAYGPLRRTPICQPETLSADAGPAAACAPPTRPAEPRALAPTTPARRFSEP